MTDFLPICAGTAVALIVATLVAKFALRNFTRTQTARASDATADQIPEIVQALGRAKSENAFAVFLFVPAGGDPTDPVHLQYSVVGGKVGLEWELVAPVNVADHLRVLGFIAARGFSAAKQERNEVAYFRVEGPGIAALGTAIITDFYGLPAKTGVDLVLEGFDWTAAPSMTADA